MRVLAVTHGPTVQPELFGDVIRDEGHELLQWEIERASRPAGDPDAVVVLGGHQNVGEEAEHPWLEDEYELLRGWIGDGTPLLGVCLGAQALAHALGGSVTRLPRQQAGFGEVWLTAAGRDDPVLGALPHRFEALFGNAYGFTLPADAALLADSAVSPQAFRAGARAWAVQFHPEARRDQALGWYAADADDLPRPLEELERELDAKMGDWQRLGTALCRAFLATAARA